MVETWLGNPPSNSLLLEYCQYKRRANTLDIKTCSEAFPSAKLDPQSSSIIQSFSRIPLCPRLSYTHSPCTNLVQK